MPLPPHLPPTVSKSPQLLPLGGAYLDNQHREVEHGAGRRAEDRQPLHASQPKASLQHTGRLYVRRKGEGWGGGKGERGGDVSGYQRDEK